MQAIEFGGRSIPSTFAQILRIGQRRGKKEVFLQLTVGLTLTDEHGKTQ
jgi:hypothetical protein